jgi:hypothetical protein
MSSNMIAITKSILDKNGSCSSVTCCIAGIKLASRMEMMPAIRLYRHLVVCVGGAAGLLPLVPRGVNQSSRFDYISTLGSPSITSLLFSSRFFLSCDLSHFSRFSQVLKRNIMTYDVP